jgi:hypothetical protein
MHSDAHDIQAVLRARYERFRLEAEVPLLLAPRLSSPLLVAVSDSWLASQFRILIVGQEVLGWNFAAGRYYDWPFSPIKNFHEFKTNQDAVEALIQGYKAFDYSKYQPENARGPFWVAYRTLRDTLEGNIDASILWTNLFRMSVDVGSVIRNASSDEILILQKVQVGLLTDEISILKPKVIVFFTGPYYDNALAQEFPNIGYSPLKSRTTRVAAILSHPKLPLCSIRTYHPGFLRRRGLWPILDEVIELIRESFPTDDLRTQN